MTESLADLIRSKGGRIEERETGPYPLGFSPLEPELKSIEKGAGILSREGSGVLLARGPDAETFLNGLTTNDFKKLRVGGLQPHLICANKGKIRFEIEAVRTKADEFLILTRPEDTQEVAAYFNRYHVREELELGQIEFVRLDLLGRVTADVLAACGIPGRAPRGTFGEGPLVTIPADWGRLPRIVALLPAPAAPRLVARMLEADPAAVLVGWEAVEEARIRAGIPAYGTDFDEDFLPAEASLYTHIAFDKGCYVGQEIHARMHHRGHPNRKLMAVTIPEATASGLFFPPPLFHEGEEVGRVTSLARVPKNELRTGVALVRYPLAKERTPLSIAAQGPAEVQLMPLVTDLGAAAR